MNLFTKSVATVLTAAIVLGSVASAAQAGGKVISPDVPLPPLVDIPIIVILPGAPDHKNSGDDGTSGPADKPLAYTDAALNCEIITGELWLLNTGGKDISGGTRVRYTVPANGDHGAFLLPRGIDAGQKLKLSDMLGAGAEGACRVQILN